MGKDTNNDPPHIPRLTWTHLPEEQLLAQCAVDTYRASGPGGQKRNKTSSAVRLRHRPTGLLVIAEESRSQHENKAKALKRIWQELFLRYRDPLVPEACQPETLRKHPDFADALDREGRIHLSEKNPRFWPAVGVVLDVLVQCQAQVSTAAEAIGTSTANLIHFLQTEPKVWQEVNRIRMMFGQKSLKMTE